MATAAVAPLVLLLAACAAPGGQAGSGNSQSAATVTYPVNVKWGGRTDLIEGEMTVPRGAPRGSILLLLDAVGDRCEGNFQYARPPEGEWAITCQSGVTTSGTFTYYSRNNLISGVGYDSDGNWVGFDAWPPKS